MSEHNPQQNASPGVGESAGENDGRLDFAAATAFVARTRQAAFVAVPVFGDDDETAEGARIFLILPEGNGGWRLQFIAGPFFSNAYAANDALAADEIPERVREMRFLPTRCEDAWLDEQIQVLLSRLAHAAGIAEQLPDYAAQPSKAAAPEVVFPVQFIGRQGTH